LESHADALRDRMVDRTVVGRCPRAGQFFVAVALVRFLSS
jgi:hypothetical protein